jgi:hypothetical protein
MISGWWLAIPMCGNASQRSSYSQDANREEFQFRLTYVTGDEAGFFVIARDATAAELSVQVRAALPWALLALPS